MTEWNSPRWLTHVAPHIESFFIKANDPHTRRALWLKVTCLRSQDPHASSESDALDFWCCFFDEEAQQFVGGRKRVPLHNVTTEDAYLFVDTEGFSVTFDQTSGAFSGIITTESEPIHIQIKWQAAESRLGAGYGLFPFQWMLKGPIPKQKTVTPIGLAEVEGHISIGQTTIPVENWLGCQGHNWGRAHTPDYVWTHAIFLENGAPVAICEAFTGSVRAAGRLLGPFSGLVLCTLEGDFRFDRLIDLWNQNADFKDGRYVLELKNGRHRIRLEVTAALESVLCLGYADPDHTMHYCMNSKLAHGKLEFSDGIQTRIYESEHCVALEWLDAHPLETVI